MSLTRLLVSHQAISQLGYVAGHYSDAPSATPANPLNLGFVFKDYAPKVFHEIRQLFGINSESYVESVCGGSNFIEFLSNSKSGQFFFYSPDGTLIYHTTSVCLAWWLEL